MEPEDFTTACAGCSEIADQEFDLRTQTAYPLGAVRSPGNTIPICLACVDLIEEGHFVSLTTKDGKWLAIDGELIRNG